MNSKMVFGQYYQANSWMHRLDPRIKIVGLILLMISIFLINNIYYLLGFFGFTVLIVLTTKIPFIKFLQSLKMLTFLLLFMFVFQVLFRRTGTLLATFNFTLTIFNLIAIVVLLLLYFLSGKVIKKFRLLLFVAILVGSFVLQYYWIDGIVIANYNIAIYEDSLLTASFVFVRIVSILFMSSLLTLSTKPMELNQGLEALMKPLKVFKINPSIFTMMIAIALRFIPTLINEANKILKAQASRGVDFKESKLSEKISQIISLIVPMFVIAYRRAIDLSDAMEARGYDPDLPRTSLNVLKMKFSDYVTLFIVSGIFVGIIVLKILYQI